jgi:dihydrodipicolinate synthase/N-acetylneuraminate lyase
MQPTWTGVYTALTTKFTSNDSLDLPAMEAHIRRQIDGGVHGIIVLGSLGENGTLDPDEKLAIVDMAADACKGKVPLLAAVAEPTTARAQKFVAKAGEKVAGFMVLPGMLYPADEREAEHHFRAVAGVSARPIMIYNNPVSYRVDVTPEMFERLADEPRFVAIKESSDNVRRVTDIINRTGDRYAIFTGVDDIALESLALGAAGWVAGLVCAFPRETVVLYELVKASKMREAVELYRWFMPLLHLDVSTKFVQNIKLVEHLVDGVDPRVRAPRLQLTGEERARVEATVAQALAHRPKFPQVKS